MEFLKIFAFLSGSYFFIGIWNLCRILGNAKGKYFDFKKRKIFNFMLKSSLVALIFFVIAGIILMINS